MIFPDQPGRTASIAEWAIWNAAIGRLTGAYKVFPCWPGEKHPLRKGWQADASWDRLTVETIWANSPKANIGLALQPGFLAIDGDLYKPGKEAALDAFEAKHGALPDTLEFRSARGGVHLIYRTARTFGNSRGTLPDFGDIRGHGGLIIGPGSYFEGLRYGVEGLAQPAALPASIDGCLIEKKHLSPEERRELPQFVSLDDPRNIARFVAWLQSEARFAVEGQGGNNVLAATGAAGSSYALSWDTTLECMADHWNPRCEPPWDDADLEKHGGSGYRSASSAFGNMADRDPKLMFPTVTAPKQPYAGWGSQAVSIAELRARGPAPERQWALGSEGDGWMPLGDLTLLYGPGGAGKTTLVGQMALSFDAGTPLFGNIPARKMKVLYVGCEDDMSELHRRFELQSKGTGGENVSLVSLIGHDTALHPPFAFGTIREDTPDTPFYQFLEHHLSAMGDGDKVLFLDNLGQMYFGDDTNKAQVSTFMNRYVRRLLLAHGATCVILAHPSSSQIQSGEGGAGSPAWSANVRSHLFFDWQRDGKNGESGRPAGDIRVLSRKKANYSRVHKPGEGVFLARGADWRFSVVEKPPTPETPKAKKVREGAPQPEDVNSLFISRKCLQAMMENFPGRVWPSDISLARDLAATMGAQGHTVSDRTLERHLKTHRASGFPHYHVDGGWTCKVKV